MSKSNVVEIVALLWFILATQVSNHFVRGFAIGIGTENIVEAIVFAYQGRKS